SVRVQVGDGDRIRPVARPVSPCRAEGPVAPVREHGDAENGARRDDLRPAVAGRVSDRHSHAIALDGSAGAYTERPVTESGKHRDGSRVPDATGGHQVRLAVPVDVSERNLFCKSVADLAVDVIRKRAAGVPKNRYRVSVRRHEIGMTLAVEVAGRQREWKPFGRVGGPGEKAPVAAVGENGDGPLAGIDRDDVGPSVTIHVDSCNRWGSAPVE